MLLGHRSLAIFTFFTVAACGGRTQSNDGASGEVVEVETSSDETATSQQVPDTQAPPTAAPTPGFPTTNTPTAIPTTTPNGIWIQPPVTEPVVSPPHADECPFPGVTEQPAVSYTYSDGVTTIDLKSAFGSSEWCAYGSAGPSGSDYSNWGAGMGGFVGYQTNSGAIVPFDASALGAVGIRFSIYVENSPVRLMLTEVNTPAVPAGSSNYEDNAFVWGGSSPREMDYTGTYEVRFEDFALPAWTTLSDEFQRPFDASRVHSFQFMITNDPADAFRDYLFCVTDVQWVDACGNAVAINTAAEVSPVVDDPTLDPSTTASDGTSLAWPELTSGPSSLGPASSAVVETSELPWAWDAGAVETGAVETDVMETGAVETDTVETEVVNAPTEPAATNTGVDDPATDGQ